MRILIPSYSDLADGIIAGIAVVIGFKVLPQSSRSISILETAELYASSKCLSGEGTGATIAISIDATV